MILQICFLLRAIRKVAFYEGGGQMRLSVGRVIERKSMVEWRSGELAEDGMMTTMQMVILPVFILFVF